MTKNEDSARRLTALVAIIRAAHLARDRDLERSAKQELAERFDMRLSFCTQDRPTEKGDSND